MTPASRRLTFSVSALGLAAAAWAGGVHLGMPCAVKSKVRELDDKVKISLIERDLLSGTAAAGRPIANTRVSARECAGKTLDATGLAFPLLLVRWPGTLK